MFYAVLNTKHYLCLADSKHFPDLFKDKLGELVTFSDRDSAIVYLNNNISFDALWLFGLEDVTKICTGQIYYQ